MLALTFIILFAVSFLLGSIPWGVILSRGVYKTDIRKQGSGNIGATNAVRTMGTKGGVAVFVLDAAKGALAGALAWFVCAPFLAHVLTAQTIELFFAITGNIGAADAALSNGQLNLLCASVAFLGCVLGHIFSPWLKFQGGKGISVAFGCEFFALTPLGALLELAVFAVFAVSTRLVSLGSVMAAAACPFIALWLCWPCWPAIVISSVAALFVIWAHRGNIARLMRGEERRFSFSSKGSRDKGEADDS